MLRFDSEFSVELQKKSKVKVKDEMEKRRKKRKIKKKKSCKTIRNSTSLEGSQRWWSLSLSLSLSLSISLSLCLLSFFLRVQRNLVFYPSRFLSLIFFLAFARFLRSVYLSWRATGNQFRKQTALLAPLATHPVSPFVHPCHYRP